MYARTATLLLTLFAMPCLAGVLFEFETTDLTQPELGADTIHTLVDGERIMVDVSGPRGANADMVYRGDRREMIGINHEDQSYVVIDDATIVAIGEQLSGLEAQIQEALKDAPPEQRAMMEEMIRQRMPQARNSAPVPSYSIKPTGESGEENGFPVRKYELYSDSKLSKVFWVTDWDNVEGAREAVAAFESMADFISDLQDAMPNFAKSPAVGSHAYEHFDDLDGFPVVTIDIGADGAPTGETRLKTSAEQEVDPAAFEPPAGYSQMQVMQ